MNLRPILACVGMLAMLSACETFENIKDSMGMGGNEKYVVYFKSNSTRLTEKSEGTLFDAMQAIREKKIEKVRIVAYTDSKGNRKYNQQLSMKRAKSIRKRLKKAGAKTIEVAGGGMAKATETGAQARRAEIFFVQ